MYGLSHAMTEIYIDADACLITFVRSSVGIRLVGQERIHEF